MARHEEWIAPCRAIFDSYAAMVQHGLAHGDYPPCQEWARWSMTEGSGRRPVGTSAPGKPMTAEARDALQARRKPPRQGTHPAPPRAFTGKEVEAGAGVPS